MFQTLLASRRSAPRFSPASVVAIVVHMALAAAAASATIAKPSARSSPVARPLPIYAPTPKTAPQPATAATAPRSVVSAPVLPVVSDLPSLAPISASVPTSNPLASAELRAITGTTGVRPAIGIVGEPGGTALSDAALGSDLVDDPVVVLSQRPPRYPAALEAAGVTGAVRLAFVVDTSGRVEPGSLRAVEVTAPGFEAAAREALLATRFRPARVRGRPVRQLAEQWVRFAARR